MADRPDWIAVDWGNTHLRAWAMRGASPMARRDSAQGVASLPRDGFEPALLALVGDWLDEGREMPVYACGAVGSREGWHEVPYRNVPCAALGARPVAIPARDPRVSVHLAPGLSQSSPPDVLRGEETQVAGFLALHAGWDGVICLPGTHSKWVHVSAGQVVSFQSFLTGESFAALSQGTILRHGMAGWDDTGFDEGAAQGLDRPDRLLARIANLRGAHILQGLNPAIARARLSGLLVGAELAAAKPYWLGQRVAVLGQAELARLYVRALGRLSVPATAHEPEGATLAGLAALRATTGG